MLSKKGFMTVAVLAVLCLLSGCGKKEESQQAETAQPSKPEVNPGEMVFVPAGEFLMGTNTKGTDNKETVSYPEHKVNLPAFWIDKYEVTNFQMLEFAIKERYTGEGAKEGKDWRLFATPDKALFPVQYVTLNDAKAFCKSAGKRLPTEAEWEKAARGADGKAYPWGNDWMEGKSNTAESGLLKPAAVGQFDDVGPYGAYDMLGNVREWTSSPLEMYPGSPVKNPGKGRIVARGLSPNHKGKMAHLWDRDAYPAEYLGDIGFRCAKDATPEDTAKAAQAK